MAKQEKYLPQTRVSKTKSTPGGEFVLKGTEDFYKGSYVETFDGKYYAGQSLASKGTELEKVATLGKEDNLIGGVVTTTLPVLLTLLQRVFKKTPTVQEKERGVAKRYFIQDKKNNKIIETDKENYIIAQQQLKNRVFAETDWIIKGPAEDKIINGYPYEGAASKNKKAIQALESQIPGISTYITNYSELVEEPVTPQEIEKNTEILFEQDPVIVLENSRKANFDTRK